MLKRGYFSFKLFLLYLLAFIKSFVHVVTSTLAFVFIDLSNAIESMQKCAKDFFPLDFFHRRLETISFVHNYDLTYVITA